LDAERKLNTHMGTISGTIRPIATDLRPARVANSNDENQLDGAEGQNRTADTVIFSHVLYQLSYLGTRRRA
jgi:hypothetical protein